MGQDSREDVLGAVELESRQRIVELERKLKDSEDQVRNNQAAESILNRMLEQGDAELNDDGSVSVSKKKPFGDSVMENSFNI